MTIFNYSTKITEKNITSNIMTVEYTPLDNAVLTTNVPMNISSGIVDDVIVQNTEMVPRGRISLVIPIPFVDQDLVEYIKSYAPLSIWEKMISDFEKQITDVTIGESITITGHSQAITSMTNFDDLPYIPHPTISL